MMVMIVVVVVKLTVICLTAVVVEEYKFGEVVVVVVAGNGCGRLIPDSHGRGGGGRECNWCSSWGSPHQRLSLAASQLQN